MQLIGVCLVVARTGAPHEPMFEYRQHMQCSKVVQCYITSIRQPAQHNTPLPTQLLNPANRMHELRMLFLATSMVAMALAIDLSTQRSRDADHPASPFEDLVWHPTVIWLCFWLQRLVYPPAFKRHRKSIRHAQFAEIVNSGRSGLHRVPAEVFHMVLGYLDAKDMETLGETCQWFRLTLNPPTARVTCSLTHRVEECARAKEEVDKGFEKTSQ